MKDFGKVKEYNGYYGKIINQDGKDFLLLDSQIMDNQNINNSDFVTFIAEKYQNSEVNEDIARFVKKYEKEK